MGISALLASQILDASATGRSVITGADASAIRTTLGLGTLSTQSPTGTPSASTFLRGDFSWQTIDLSGYLQLTGGTMTGQLTITQGTANTSVLASTGYSLTGSNAQSLIDVAGTWNTTGTPTLIKANVTDTASNAASLLLDLQVGGSSRLNIAKNGSITTSASVAGQTYGIYLGNGIAGAASAYRYISFATNWGNVDFLHWGGRLAFYGVGTSNVVSPSFVVNSTGSFEFSSGDAFTAGGDVVLRRDSAGVLAQRNSTNAQTFRVYNTYTDSSNYERAKIAWESNVLRIGTEKAGTGSARALELQTDGTTRLTIGATGLFTIADALNIAVGTTTGTKIGTATTQKIGFFDKTPVVQPTAVADATDAASVITQLNALLSRMRDLGLIAT